MLNKQQVMALLKSITDRTLNKTLAETNGVRAIQAEKGTDHVGLTIAIGKINTPEQTEIEAEIVNKFNRVGVESIAIQFEAFTEAELARLNQAKSEPPSLLTDNGKTKFIAIASGKGGVGKSTVTVNVAVALARLGKKVGIVDADIYGFSVPDMMGITDRPTLKGNRIIPVTAKGVQVMSMGFFVEDNEPVIWRGPRLGKMLRSFFVEVEWDELDYLLLDLPPGTGDMALSVHQMIPSSKELIVTTPHSTAAFVASRAGKMAINTNHEIIGVIENMSYFQSQLTGEKEYVFGQGGGEKLADELQAPLIAQIPLGQPSKQGSSIYEEIDPIGQIYLQVAQFILDRD
ncbi:P-loop NTPase [Amphibacillus indicireducens]|uniref:Iron-sulfur cluster carrier protein n=1 Tax=Amphibacillus indicireducens TaxID=1076330 RepID=A0ABP7V4H3_9BACI